MIWVTRTFELFLLDLLFEKPHFRAFGFSGELPSRQRRHRAIERIHGIEPGLTVERVQGKHTKII